MKVFNAVFLVSILFSVLIVASPSHASGGPSVGVKEGDWMEYNVNITGNAPPIHQGVVEMRIEVMHVEGAAFPANFTLRFANGTLSSSIWQFNFTEGNVGGWIIIPSILAPGKTFFDNFSKTDKEITIQSQERQTVLGASRTVTYANDSYRFKEWDKETGVFIRSSEIFRNWSAYVNLISTNLWRPQILGLNPTVFYMLTSISVGLAVLIMSSAIVAFRKRGRTE